MTKPEPRLLALYGRRGGPKNFSKGSKNSWNGSPSPPGPPGMPRLGPPFTSCVLEMLTTDGERCSARAVKSGRVTVGGAPVEPDSSPPFSPPPKRLIAWLAGNRSNRTLTARPTTKPISATANSARRLDPPLIRSLRSPSFPLLPLCCPRSTYRSEERRVGQQ